MSKMAAQASGDSGFDLQAYLRRVGWEGSVEPTLPVLSKLMEAHCHTFPFENLYVRLRACLHISALRSFSHAAHRPHSDGS